MSFELPYKNGKMTAKEIAWAIVHYSAAFALRRHFLIVENISWGLFSWGECDLLVCANTYYLTDIEIKISIADLKNDFSKKKWKMNSYYESIKFHYYAIPVELMEKALPLIEFNRPNSGIISMERKIFYPDEPEKSWIRDHAHVIKKASAHKEAKPLAEKYVLHLARLTMFRYWRSKNED